MTKIIALSGAIFLFNLIVVCWSDGVMSFDLSWKFESNDKLENVCPNNHTKCNNRQTCCKTKHNSYHCCRYPHAVCCPDRFHCCPQGSTCDTERKRCTRNVNIPSNPIETTPEPMEMPVVIEKSVELKTNDQTCPNNRTKCKDTQTCCVTKHDSYHCCKYENAVCCPDKFHCCPEDSTCDTRRHRCVKSIDKMKKLVPAFTLKENENSESLEKSNIKNEVVCPNNKTKCNDSKTCCITKHNNYYCCPHKNAVCCSDKYQCCPEGTTCDVENKKCVKSSFVFDSHKNEEILPAILTTALNDPNDFLLKLLKLDKKCPDTKTTCPGKKNCCVMESGKFGCCQFNKGICCPDLKTCCPHDTVCDVKNNKCFADPQNLKPV